MVVLMNLGQIGRINAAIHSSTAETASTNGRHHTHSLSLSAANTRQTPLYSHGTSNAACAISWLVSSSMNLYVGCGTGDHEG